MTDNNTSNPVEKNKKSNAKDGMYITIIVLLLIGGAYLGWMVSDRNTLLAECSDKNTGLETELAEINDIFSESEVEMVSEDLKSNLQMMLSDYENMEAVNKEMEDSLIAQKEKIENLMKQVERNKYNVREIYKLRKEAATLREIMKGYVRTIDSLNTVNQGLRTDLSQTQEQLGSVSTERDKYKDISNELETKVSSGSKLVATGISSDALKTRMIGNNQTETDKAKRTDFFKVCMTIAENRIASAGKKNIYLRIISPAGSVLHQRQSNTLKTESGKNILFSDNKMIDYQNTSVDVCIFYDVKGEEMKEGDYIIEIYADGVVIGKDKIRLD